MSTGRQRVLLAAVIAGLAAAYVASAGTQEPVMDRSAFTHVSHVGWVVKDLDAVVGHWQKLGLRNIRRADVEDFPDLVWRGRKAPTRLKQAFADLDNVTIQWIQPVSGENGYSDFLARRGDGIHHLAYVVPAESRWREQVAAFRAKGVEVVQEGSWQGRHGVGRFAYLATAERGGGLTIELEYDPDGADIGDTNRTGQDYPFTKVTQYAFVVRDLKKVSDFYEGIGLGPLPFDRMVATDRMYRGRAVPFEMYLGWGRHGDVPFEWIQSLAGPNVYEEHLTTRGEGFHHLAFNVPDMDEAIARMHARGTAVTQSGGWDQPTGKGRFAYLDTDRVGGVTIELLWNKP